MSCFLLAANININKNVLYNDAFNTFRERDVALVQWVVGSILHGGSIEPYLIPASAPRLV